MPVHTLLRILAILLTVFFAFALRWRETVWYVLVYGMGFAHYYLSLIYSRKQIAGVAGLSSSWLPLVLVLGGGMLLYGFGFSLIIYFGIHHAFNEVYLLNRLSRDPGENRLRPLRTAGVLLNFLVYIYVLRSFRELAWIDMRWVATGILVLYPVFFYFLLRLKDFWNWREIIDNSSLEIISIVFIALSFFIPIRFTQIVLFHFVFWAVYPLPKLLKGGSAGLTRYAGITLALLAVVFLVSPLGIWSYPLEESIFKEQFYFWSYFHITLSFAVSSAHPRWITRWFQPAAISP